MTVKLKSNLCVVHVNSVPNFYINNATCIFIDGLVQDCNNSIANLLELLQSCTKPPICALLFYFYFTLAAEWRDLELKEDILN